MTLAPLFKLRRALVAGTLGAIVTVVILVAGGWLAYRESAAVRELFTALPPGLRLRIVWGIVAICVAISGGTFIGTAYAFAFEFVTRRAGALIGTLLGVVHGIVIWLGAGLLAWWFPRLANPLWDVLFIVLNTWYGILIFATSHVLYGTVVGALYGETLHEPDTQAVVWWREISPHMLEQSIASEETGKT